MIFTCLGFCSSNKGLYLSAITEALDLERSAFSLGDTFRYLSTAAVNLFFGRLIRNFGEKKLILAVFFCLIASCSLYATAETVPGFYCGSCLLGIGLAWTTTTMVGWIVGRHCKERKGTVMGGVLTATKFLTGFLCDRWGIRKTVLLCDAAAIIVLLALIFMDARTPALAILYAFAAAMALPLETVMLPLLAGAFFEEAAYPRALELFVSVCTAGFALGSPLMNLIFDLQGSYRPALIVAVLLMAGVTVTIQWVIARKEKKYV